MDRLWSPWRSEYIAAGSSADSKPGGCVFCEIQRDPSKDEKNFVLHRAKHNFVVLNIHPYIPGHLLIVPYQHVSDLDSTSSDTTNEMMDLTKRSQTLLREAYKPSGYNIGMNLGAAAGAGIVDHIHLHILPRWIGDSNFMSTVGGTRVLPEDLVTTYHKLRGKF
ncbi:MAG: HIT domain-containing protein [Pyrinomonadaceae bacterium]|nr:HIT domain-containing protein [Pyrinomonadaceae bacterium]